MTDEEKPFRHRRESIVFEPELAEGSLLVQGYNNGSYKVANRMIEGAIYVTARSVRQLDVTAVDDIVGLDMAGWFEDYKPDLLFLGTGPSMALVPAEIREKFTSQGVTVEPMDSGAAARTYNVLLIEGRDVAALLLPTQKTR